MYLGAGGRKTNVNFSVDVLVTDFYCIYLIKAICSQRAMSIPGEHRIYIYCSQNILGSSQDSLQFKLIITQLQDQA